MIPTRAVGRASRVRLESASKLFLRYSSTAPRAPEESDKAPSPRWLSDTKARIGKCITFGMSKSLVDEAGQVLGVLGRDWRALTAGSEGFLTDPRRAGLHRHKIVWGEQDSMGHVNNVMYVRYAESSRCNTVRNFAKHVDPVHRKAWENLLSNQGIGLILKSITVDFKFPMTWPDRISVYHKLRSCPDEKTTSLVLDVLILSENKQRPAARCLEESVIYDYRVSKKSTMEPFMVEQLRTTFELQETAKRENLAKVQLIEEQVRHLEKQSWDRPDAVEDFGGATKQ
ncbi:thioesterase-like superfamily-domain-containing protein [Exophiala viscosa]|uniref:Thioesterase-like superfamily-domain-containing protein n=1 Tax=Exophiala viscosa TaxID=2486360 RepID=A0AAN6E829_9EURO|nr:thioesterase-like superfamily-domain-containing protein [Exophiala viscosa]KAI1627632.1 thioesterase-like superfamily-domain-containing protein [Exophiala viscosa]